MRQRASPTRPPEGRGPGGPPQGGARAPSGGGRQGIPIVRRVICERGGATWWSLHEGAGTAGAPQAITVPHSAAMRRRERREAEHFRGTRLMNGLSIRSEPPRVLRRLPHLREWSHEDIRTELPRGYGACRAFDVRSQGAEPSEWAAIVSMLKNKGQPRSGETGTLFMPPRRTRAGRSAAGWRESAVRRRTARRPDRPSRHLRTR